MVAIFKKTVTKNFLIFNGDGFYNDLPSRTKTTEKH
jgi:hypothetical protein